MTSLRLPKHIAIRRHGNELRVHVDGAELPCPISATEPLDVQVGRGFPSTVRLTLVAQHITMEDAGVEAVEVRDHRGLVRSVVVGEAPGGEDDQAAFGIVEEGEHIAFRCSDACTLQISGGRITCGPGTSPACADASLEA